MRSSELFGLLWRYFKYRLISNITVEETKNRYKIKALVLKGQIYALDSHKILLEPENIENIIIDLSKTEKKIFFMISLAKYLE